MCWRFFKYKLVVDDIRNKLKRDCAFMEAAIRELKSNEPSFSIWNPNPRASTSGHTTVNTPLANCNHNPCFRSVLNGKRNDKWVLTEAVTCDSTSMEPPPSSPYDTPTATTSGPSHLDDDSGPSPRDFPFAFDYGHTGRLDHVAIYRPGPGIIKVLRNDNGAFIAVYPKSVAGHDESGDELDSPTIQILRDVPQEIPAVAGVQPDSPGARCHLPASPQIRAEIHEWIIPCSLKPVRKRTQRLFSDLDYLSRPLAEINQMAYRFLKRAYTRPTTLLQSTKLSLHPSRVTTANI